MQIRTLYELEGNSLTDFDPYLIQIYSLYKYGVERYLEFFAVNLSKIILKDLKLGIPINDWVMVTPSYSTVISPIIPLAKEISNITNIPLVETKTSKEGSRNLVYSSLEKLEDRQKHRELTDLLVDEEKIKGKNILLLDDMLVTKATVYHLAEILKSNYQIKRLRIYCIINLKTQSPSVEEQINSYILLNSQPPKLAELFNEPGTIMNRHTIRSIMNSPDHIFDDLLTHLSTKRRKELASLAKRYYQNSGNFKDRINVLAG